MVNKKKEMDDFIALSEKDLWCQDLDAFLAEWDARLVEDSEITKKIRGLGRRASKKIGAGKGGKAQSRLKTANDDEYAPKAPKVQKANAAKGVVKVEPPKKSSQKFLSMFTAKPKPVSKDENFGSDGIEELSGLSDDDFAAVASAKPIEKPASVSSHAPIEQATAGRSKRAAAAKPKRWVLDDDETGSDDDKLLGDVGDMVKGISTSSLDTGTGNGRVSLFAMSRPGSSSGMPPSSSGLPKAKAKSKTVIDLSDGDETNYEMLAQTSPQKAAQSTKELDSLLSDDDDHHTVIKKKAPAQRPKKAPAPPPKKTAPSVAPTLSPAAKAYALKKTKTNTKPARKKEALSEDDSDNIKIAEPDSPQAAVKAYTLKQTKTKSKPARKKAVLSEDDSDVIKIAEPDSPQATAKAFTLKQTKTKTKPARKKAVLSDDDSDKIEIAEPDSPPAAKARPSRAAAAKPKKMVYESDDDMDIDELDASEAIDEGESDDFDSY